MEKIFVDGDMVLIKCPSCGNWEHLGIDDSRKNLQYLPIIKWIFSEGKPEVSVHKCSECNVQFNVEWDYTNTLKKETASKLIAEAAELHDKALNFVLGLDVVFGTQDKIGSENNMPNVVLHDDRGEDVYYKVLHIKNEQIFFTDGLWDNSPIMAKEVHDLSTNNLMSIVKHYS